MSATTVNVVAVVVVFFFFLMVLQKRAFTNCQGKEKRGGGGEAGIVSKELWDIVRTSYKKQRSRHHFPLLRVGPPLP